MNTTILLPSGTTLKLTPSQKEELLKQLNKPSKPSRPTPIGYIYYSTFRGDYAREIMPNTKLEFVGHFFGIKDVWLSSIIPPNTVCLKKDLPLHGNYELKLAPESEF